MENTTRLKVSIRLALVFCVLILLLVSSMALLLIQQRQTEAEMDQLLNQDIRKLRAIDEYSSLSTEVSLRIMAITKSHDPAIGALFGPQIPTLLHKLETRFDQIKASATTEAETAAIKEMIEHRALMLKALDQVNQAKKVQDSELAAQLFDTAFLPARQQYLAQVVSFVAIQQAQLELRVVDTQQTARKRALWMVGLAGLLGLVSALLAWRLSRHISSSLSLAVRTARAVADGDLTQQCERKGGDEFADLMRSLDDMGMSLNSVVSQVRTGTHSIAIASAEIAQGNQNLSERTENQASALQHATASMGRLGTTVRQNAEDAHIANRVALEASQVAARGGEVVSQVVETMKGIDASSRRISDIIGVIDSIAFQTNILALNAAVEAARAGDQGRGFAVVASEVRNLAQRTAGAAKEVKTLITESSERVTHGTQLVDNAGATMNDVVSGIQRATALIKDISTASTEQSASVSQVELAVTQIDAVTQQNAALVEEMAAAAASLRTQSSQLVKSVAVFKVASASVGGGTRVLKHITS